MLRRSARIGRVGCRARTEAEDPKRAVSAKRQNSRGGGKASTQVHGASPSPKAPKASAEVRAKAVDGPSRCDEMAQWTKGLTHIAGVDEAGRGPLAGPVVAGACCIPQDVYIEGVADSKKLSEAKREEIYGLLTGHPRISWGVSVVSAGVVDEINILQAAMLAMEQAVGKLSPKPDYVLVDGNRLPKALDPDRAHFIIKGDAKCYAIAAASIIAKVTRDRLMIEYDKQWPQYDLKNNKGYGTAKHMAAIEKSGPCEIHRRTFAPLKNMNLPPAK